MTFKEEYTTASKKAKDEKEKDKSEISEEAYCIASIIEENFEKLRLSTLLK